MSINIASTHVGTWKRIKVQYLAAMLGIGVAAAIAVGVASIDTGLTAAPAKSETAWHTSSTAQPVSYVFYLVDSDAQRDALIGNARGDEFPSPSDHFLVAPTLSDEVSLAGTVRELSALGNYVRVEDLRVR